MSESQHIIEHFKKCGYQYLNLFGMYYFRVPACVCPLRFGILPIQLLICCCACCPLAWPDCSQVVAVGEMANQSSQ